MLFAFARSTIQLSFPSQRPIRFDHALFLRPDHPPNRYRSYGKRGETVGRQKVTRELTMTRGVNQGRKRWRREARSRS